MHEPTACARLHCARVWFVVRMQSAGGQRWKAQRTDFYGERLCRNRPQTVRATDEPGRLSSTDDRFRDSGDCEPGKVRFRAVASDANWLAGGIRFQWARVRPA